MSDIHLKIIRAKKKKKKISILLIVGVFYDLVNDVTLYIQIKKIRLRVGLLFGKNAILVAKI